MAIAAVPGIAVADEQGGPQAFINPIQIEAQRGFTKAGHSLPGGAVRINLFGDRVAVEATEVYGADIIDRLGVVQPGQLTEQANRRREFGLGIDAIDTQVVDLDLSAGFSDLSLPGRRAGEGLSLTEVEGWRDNRVGNIGFDLGLLGGRVRQTSRYFWSEYRSYSEPGARAALSEEAEAGGQAQWHRIDVDILDVGPVDLDAYGSYSLIGDDFQSLRYSSVSLYDPEGNRKRIGGSPDLASAPPQPGRLAQIAGIARWLPGTASAPGEDREAGAAVEIGPLRLSTARRLEAVELRGQEPYLTTSRKNEAALNFEPVQVKLWQRDRHTKSRQTELHGARVLLSLDSWIGRPDPGEGGAVWALVPSAIVVDGDQYRAAGRKEGAAKDDERRVGFGLDWETDAAFTSLYVSRTRGASRADGETFATWEDQWIDVSHTISGEDWDVSAYAWANRFIYDEDFGRSVDSYLGGGVSASWSPKGWPGLTAAVDFNRYGSTMLYEDWDSRYFGQDFDVTAALDFSEMLAGELGHEPVFLELSYHYLGESESELENGEQVDRTRMAGHAALVRFGMQF